VEQAVATPDPIVIIQVAHFKVRLEKTAPFFVAAFERMYVRFNKSTFLKAYELNGNEFKVCTRAMSDRIRVKTLLDRCDTMAPFVSVRFVPEREEWV
jgi:hypothetical protein